MINSPCADPPIMSLPDVGPINREGRRAPADARRSNFLRRNGGVLALIIISFGFMAIVGLRNVAVRALPPLARAYAAVGLPINLRGLDIRGLKSNLLRNNGRSVLAVEGEIVNLRPHPSNVPPIRIGVEGADGQEIYTWTTEAPKARLGDHEKIDFRARLTSPPAGAHTVLVKFAPARN